jgi:hypothetical protein
MVHLNGGKEYVKQSRQCGAMITINCPWEFTKATRRMSLTSSTGFSSSVVKQLVEMQDHLGAQTSDLFTPEPHSGAVNKVEL